MFRDVEVGVEFEDDGFTPDRIVCFGNVKEGSKEGLIVGRIMFTDSTQ